MGDRAPREAPPRGAPPAGYRAVWQVKGDDPWGWPTQWIDYNEEYNKVIELAFQNEIFSLNYQPGRTQLFQINLDHMNQVNITSGKDRPIRRILVHIASEVDVEDEWDIPQPVVVDSDPEPNTSAMADVAFDLDGTNAATTS
jgi:hypothetical protein